MVWDSPAIQVGIVVMLAVIAGYVLRLEGDEHWRAVLERRFIYGFPLGSAVTVVGVVGFYLVAQSGLTHWGDPVVHAFRSFSYSYVLGWLAAGFAHAGPSHLLGNMMGTVVFSPIVEYAWSHYPPESDGDGDNDGNDDGGDDDDDAEPVPSAEFSFAPPSPLETTTGIEEVPAYKDTDGNGGDANGGDGNGGGVGHWLRTNPWARALVVFPAAMLIVSFMTSFFALGWSLGFSGTVFVLVGFALMVYPLTTVVSMVVFSGLSVVIAALRNPVLVATADPGPPGPPSWVGINVQAHLLGFLIGVLLALVLLSSRDRRPDVTRIAFASVLIVLVRGLWAFAFGSDDVYRQYRGIGVIFVLAIALLVIATVATKDEPLPRPSEGSLLIPSYRTAAWLWLGLVVGGAVALLAWQGVDQGLVATVVALGVVLAFPSFPVLVPERVLSRPLTRRHLVIGGLILVTIIVALPSIPFNLSSMGTDTVPNENGLEIRDYTITYDEEASHGRFDSNDSGVIVVSERREMWSSIVRKGKLAHSGQETVTVGGVAWREEVTVTRTGWNVDGNDSAYVVDLEHDGRESRAFESDPVTARSTIDDRNVTVDPEPNGFYLNVTRAGELLGRVEIPAVNGSETVGDLTIVTEPDGENEGEAVFAERDGTRVLIAESETYG